MKLWKLDRADNLWPTCKPCPKTEDERRTTCMEQNTHCDVFKTREKWTEIKSKQSP